MAEGEEAVPPPPAMGSEEAEVLTTTRSEEAVAPAPAAAAMGSEEAEEEVVMSSKSVASEVGTKRPAEAMEPEKKTEEEASPEKSEPDGKLRLAGLEFANREALWSRVQEVTERLEPEGMASGVDQFFLFALLEAHPTCDEKMAGGVTGIGYGANAEFPETKSYHVEVADGTRRGFSVRKCVEELFPEGEGPLFLGSRAKRFKAERGAGSGSRAPGTAASPRAFESGSILTVSGLEGQGISIRQLKDAFGKFGTVRWVTIEDDEGTAVVRFDTAAAADKALADFTDISGCEAQLAKPPKDQEDALRAQTTPTHGKYGGHGGGGGDVAKYGPGGGGFRGGSLGQRGSGRGIGRALGSGGRGRSRGRPIQVGRGIRAGRSLLH